MAPTLEQAKKSATEWAPFLEKWLANAIADPQQHRDIGKVLAYVVEEHVNNWISEKAGRPIKTLTGQPYDGVTDDNLPPVRNQVKFRMGGWHFETTRRNSKKNANTNSTGHVAYRPDEFDVLAIFIPGRSTFGLSDGTIRCIPVSALVDPKKPDQLVTNIPQRIKNVYDNDAKTLEVIRNVYNQTPSSPPS
jgi:hypothetical protein